MEEWRRYSGPDDIQVGTKFHHPSWGERGLPSTIIAEVTEIREDGNFLWKTKDVGTPYIVGRPVVLGAEPWSVLLPFATFKYDPKQAGDQDDDI